MPLARLPEAASCERKEGAGVEPAGASHPTVFETLGRAACQLPSHRSARIRTEIRVDLDFTMLPVTPAPKSSVSVRAGGLDLRSHRYA